MSSLKESYMQQLTLDDRIDFTMTNPPFYSSIEEVVESQAAKELDPFAVSSASTSFRTRAVY